MAEVEAAKLPEDEARSAEEPVLEAPAVLRMLWADPQNMPEHLAIWSLKHFGPRAGSAVERLRGDHPDAEPGDLEQLVIRHQTRVAVAEGAFMGGPFILLIPVAFCAALLAQAQMALEIAALAGHKPDDQMRAADLLVLQGAYDTTEEASAALAKVPPDPDERKEGRLPSGTRIDMIRRMAFLLGILGPSDAKPSRLRSTISVIVLGLVFLVGLVLPLVWVPYMALAVRRSSLRMGARATDFYADRRSSDAGVKVRKAQTVQVALAGGLARMSLLIIAPIVIAIVALLTDIDIGTGTWLSALIMLLAVSLLMIAGWYAYRLWRRRRARPAAA